MESVSWLPECLHWPFCPGIFIAILAFVAAAVTLRKEPGSRERAIWLFVFLGLMCAEVWMMSKDRITNIAKEKETREAEIASFKAIGDGIQTSNANSQKQFDATMQGINENVKTVVGGNSFCYFNLGFPTPPNGESVGFIWTKGEYPLHDVWMRLVDVPKFKESMAKAKPPLSFIQALTMGSSIVTLGNLPVGGERPIWEIKFDDKTDKFYLVEFGAMNGHWREIYHLKLIDGRWREAIKVSDVLPHGIFGKLRFLKVDPQYPKVNGQVDWEITP